MIPSPCWNWPNHPSTKHSSATAGEGGAQTASGSAHTRDSRPLKHGFLTRALEYGEHNPVTRSHHGQRSHSLRVVRATSCCEVRSMSLVAQFTRSPRGSRTHVCTHGALLTVRGMARGTGATRHPPLTMVLWHNGPKKKT